jgi:hypothetical protein
LHAITQTAEEKKMNKITQEIARYYQISMPSCATTNKYHSSLFELRLQTRNKMPPTRNNTNIHFSLHAKATLLTGSTISSSEAFQTSTHIGTRADATVLTSRTAHNYKQAIQRSWS